MPKTRRLLPHPPVIVQPTRATCWAATLASFLAVSNQRSRWYGGEGGLFGQVTPPSVMNIVDFVRSKDIGPAGIVGAGDFGLNGDAWRFVAETLFGLSRTKYYRSGDSLLNKILFERDIKTSIIHQRYVLLFFTDPDWGMDAAGGRFWHGKVVYGFEEDSSKSAFFVHGMDPDPQRPSYYPDVIVPDQSYFSNTIGSQ